MVLSAPVIEPGYLPVRWKPLLILGIVLIVFGTLALTVSFVATLVSVLAFGWLLLVTGGMETVYAFRKTRWAGTILHVVNGALSVVAGFLLLMNPAAGAVVLTLLMAMFFLIGGLVRIVVSLVTSLPHRGWVLLSGAVTLLLGIFIWRQMPGAAVWLIGTFVGVDMIMIGWSWTMAALAARKRQ
jgi:uncharacterized membrane protein HdeD (DUF308 family)